MKQALIYIGMLLLAISCGRNRDRLHTGDLLFQAGKNTEMTGAITAATGKEGPLNFSHVGIAVVGGGADSVLEATTDGGVRLTLLAEFLGRSAKIDGHPAVVAMRLKDTAGIAAAVRRARSFLGVPYDYSFRPGREKLYCSELVWESYRAEDGTPLFTARPDELPRRGRNPAAILGRPVRPTGRAGSRRAARHESQRHGTRGAPRRGAPLFLTDGHRHTPP